jgi:hypothetical protein
MSKYKSNKIIIDGIKFDSKKEGSRYIQLKALLDNNKISNLELQKEYILQPSYKKNGKTIRKISYFADFVYNENDKVIVEDVKGYKTEIYKLKKKIFEYKYPDLEIKEIK